MRYYFTFGIFINVNYQFVLLIQELALFLLFNELPPFLSYPIPFDDVSYAFAHHSQLIMLETELKFEISYRAYQSNLQHQKHSSSLLRIQDHTCLETHCN